MLYECIYLKLNNMKNLIYLAAFALLMTSCHDDEAPAIHEDTASNLISPALYMNVSTREGDKPFTGVLSIAPCTTGTSVFYGNYVNQKLTPFYGYYFVKDGEVYPNENNRVLNLPAGTYDMIYWGTPQYTEPIYAYPNVREPSYSIGGDFATQDFTLLKNPNDTTYYPTFDLVYARRSVNVGTEDLDAALHRVVSGLKISVKGKDGQALSNSITNIEIRVTNIAEKLNFYTAQPEGNPRTIAFPLVRSTDGKEMSNGIVMTFPSFGIPELQVLATLQNGQIKTFKQKLNAPLEANNKLTLSLSIGDILEEEDEGSFTIDDWNENNEEINVPVLE